MRSLAVAALSVIALAAAGCSGGSAGNGQGFESCGKTQPAGFPVSTEGLAVGDTAPDLQVMDINGDIHCTRDYTGKVLLINVGAGWCPPCRSETPDIQAVYEELNDAGFEVVMALYEDYDGGDPDEAFMNDWKNEYGITFTLIADHDNAVWGTYAPPGANAIPHNVILDKDNVVKYNDAGAMSDTFLRTRVNNYLDDPSLEY